MNTFTFDDMPGFVAKAANYVAYRYRKYGIDRDDIQQEIYLWLYDKGRLRVIRWLDNDPQQTTRIYRSMLDVGLSYAEAEKAAKVGYETYDVWWYTPSGIEGLLPLALDRTYTQEHGVIGDLITMVLDIRRALDSTGMFDYFATHDDSELSWTANLQFLVEALGGDRPVVGRRRVMTNAQAQAITGEQYA